MIFYDMIGDQSYLIERRNEGGCVASYHIFLSAYRLEEEQSDEEFSKELILDNKAENDRNNRENQQVVDGIVMMTTGHRQVISQVQIQHKPETSKSRTNGR